MNAIIPTEAVSVSALQVADPTKNLLLLSLAQLLPRRSKRNARTTPRLSIDELVASISRIGLLQNLVVILAADGEHYEVVAGDRRLTALKLLAKKKRLTVDFEVPCLLVPDASARTVSLAENLLREQMHPADQFEAFAALVKEGRPVEDIAADFGVTPLVVQRRLRLANVSPHLMADYRAGGVTLEQLMALTITDDHAAQEAAFYGAPDWQRGASALRARLTEREIDVRHPLVTFVGLEAYTAAGGGTRRDLFADDDSGTYLTDATLLETLVRGKLEVLAEDVRTEGWAWVEAVPQFSYADRQTFHNAPRTRREPSAREARRIASLQARLEKVDAELEEAYDADDEDKVPGLECREQMAAELHALGESLQGYAPEVLSVAGAVVSIDRSGEAVIHRGLLREAEANALRTLERLRQGIGDSEGVSDDAGEGAQLPKAVNLSDRLAQRLSAHRTAALQIEVARHPQVALAALAHGMVQTVLQVGQHHDGMPLGVRLTVRDRLDTLASDWPESPAAVALHELRQAWGEKLPQDGAELFAALLAMTQDELVRLIAVCVAATIDVVTPRAAQHQPGAELAQAVGLDMGIWWKPTAEGYFKHVAKAVILEAVGEFAPKHVNQLAKLKKIDIASEAERLVVGTGWMPAVFTTVQGAEAQAVKEVTEESKSAEADDEAHGHTLAA
ncbi:TPA: ParB/RepB/Spo0J family partition protein [Pseudomonas aeruginosa]|nr:ParB/RepB/Spo0J family partition protein [Pseudomonas aeruginosa]